MSFKNISTHQLVTFINIPLQEITLVQFKILRKLKLATSKFTISQYILTSAS